MLRQFSFIALWALSLGGVQAQSPSKYILYWGVMQAELTAANQYTADIQVLQPDMRKSVFTQPSVWNGKSLVRELRFQVGDMAVKSASAPDTFNAFVPLIDQKYGASLQPGDTLRIHHIALAPGVEGRVNVVLKAVEARKGMPPYDLPFASRTLSFDCLESVRWGPLFDSDQDSGVEFFSQKEFMETVLQAPQLTWKSGKSPCPMQVMVQFYDLPANINALILDLDESTHTAAMQKALQPYQHLLQPGATVMLTLRSNVQYKTEMRLGIQIVADDDPRRALRRKKDAHQVSIHWGYLKGEFSYFLKSFPAKDGTTLFADRPGPVRLMQPWEDTESEWYDDDFARIQKLEKMLENRPILRVDGREIWPFSFDVQLDTTTYHIAENELIPADLKNTLLEQLRSVNNIALVRFWIKNIRTTSNTYDFEHVSFQSFLSGVYNGNNNSLDYYKKHPLNNRIKVSEPSPNPVTDGDVRVEVDIPEGTHVVLKVFGEKGAMRFYESKDLPPGNSVFKIPSGMLEKGLNHIFIETPMGLGKRVIMKK